jgi:hypothetical protein
VSDPKLTRRQVAAWRLARQHLLDGHEARSLEQSASSTLGVQAQVASSAEQSLAVRAPGTAPSDVADALWQRRTLIKTWCMRGTLHLLASADYPMFVAALNTRDQWKRAPWLKYFGVTYDQVEGMIAAIDEALTGRCLTRQELADVIGDQHGPQMRAGMLGSWGSMLKPAAFYGILCSGPSRGQNVTFQRPVDWIGPWTQVDRDEGIRWMIRGYLHAYGPATPDGFARWWGGARKHFAAMRPELARLDVEGTAAWANPDDVDAILETKPARRSVRLLAGFDSYIMGCHPRDQIVPQAFLPRVSRTAGWISPVLLVDGAAAGVWSPSRAGDGVTISIEPFGDLPATVRRKAAKEARRLEPCVGPIADVRFDMNDEERADEPA